MEASSGRYLHDTSSRIFELPAENMEWDLLRISWLDGGSLFIEANMFMVFAASVDDKMIKFLQIKISWGINHLLGRSALWEWITKTTLTNYIYALADTETLAYGLYKPGNKVFFGL